MWAMVGEWSALAGRVQKALVLCPALESCVVEDDGGPACKGQRSDMFEIGGGELGEERKAALRPGLVEAQT